MPSSSVVAAEVSSSEDDESPTYIDCVACGDEGEEDHAFYCLYCREWRCNECGCCEDFGPCADDDDDDCSRDERVHGYSYRPYLFRPKGNYPSHALLGVELEVGGDQSDIADVVESIDPGEDHLYMKEDGSISGVEIVTHPMTLQWARQYQFAELLNRLRDEACYVDEGYGLHIHVSRNAFQRGGKQSASHQMMWLLFMYRNVSDLEKLARRTSSQWAAFVKPMPGELARKAQSIRSEPRYVAVNCNNEKTFELRFFMSTLDHVEFYAALEFADASVRYTHSIALQDVLRGKALTWRHFTEWVKRHNYKHLLAEITR
ncbi:Putative amidoligase enzyme [Mycobacteroides abscessus subsp. abscessus]|uniref:amidoligase enzyme n=1 Tax=Mycobacteroides abscessus TaxID=36809 RepID=UPI000927C707|nr:amidoligase enzyme [Mycobacteroides abscessus]SIC52359.1 Putative amidoligase enzyme [Mycobacteroides abscessus subsp. abscessus]SID06995.1 Putative amidoligase enzyme [Mycobacteroides abscessus subsp. abscessus]SID33983.1 Putative amidoligase enzyme [Mycobacteroides abscessus subsp. abscessus]SID63830.1 Putative amidoligase enzyme [Mycobacteroides abscessus subsp. abscessus]SKT65666.1 Putative amidoligase enzyme [Mycobacteroides abscessus subsp. abscessus]